MIKHPIPVCRGVYQSDKDDKTNEYINAWASFAVDAHAIFNGNTHPGTVRPSRRRDPKNFPAAAGRTYHCRLQPVVSKCALVGVFFI